MAALKAFSLFMTALLNRFSKNQIATAIAIIFHIVGLVGILIFNSTGILNSTPLNLLLSAALLIYTHQKPNLALWLFIAACVSIGFLVEVIGVNTGYLFGSYSYGTVLGTTWKQVPLIIGINWFIVMYCCGSAMYQLLQRIAAAVAGEAIPNKWLQKVSLIIDSATLAVVYDWLIEPVAVKLGFWQWKSGEIPLYNYACWFFVSLLLMLLFHNLPLARANKFAVHLLLIQMMFFLLLRSFLP
jgi:bisanhydrobacterioruberin hydratase